MRRHAASWKSKTKQYVGQHFTNFLSLVIIIFFFVSNFVPRILINGIKCRAATINFRTRGRQITQTMCILHSLRRHTLWINITAKCEVIYWQIEINMGWMWQASFKTFWNENFVQMRVWIMWMNQDTLESIQDHFNCTRIRAASRELCLRHLFG